MVDRVAVATRALCDKIRAQDIVAIGITGQQQGCQLLDDDGDLIGPFIAWQDQRGKDLVPGFESEFLGANG